MRKKLLSLLTALGCLCLAINLHAQCSGFSGSVTCFPVACDDGDPTTVNDFKLIDCTGTTECEPCKGTAQKVLSANIVNMRDCGGKLCGSNKYTADIEVIFNYAPVAEDFIITGGIYYSYDEKYCETHGDTITIPNVCFDADGELIGLNVIFNNNPSKNLINWWAGRALEPCGYEGHRVGFLNNSTTTTADLEVALTPNPATDEVSISLGNSFSGDAQIEVFDLSGKLQITSKVNYTNTALSLNISQLNAGLYLVKVTAADQVITKRLVKSTAN